MKRNLIFWLIICLALVGSSAYAQTLKLGSEPDGFRGIKWGQDVSTVDGLIYQFSNGDNDFYFRSNDELKMGAAELEMIVYVFWQDRFSGVMLFTDGSSNWENLKAVVFEKFGEGQQENEQYIWRGIEVGMVLEYNEFSEEGTFGMISMKELLEQKKWEAEQNKKGVEEDW